MAAMAVLQGTHVLPPVPHALTDGASHVLPEQQPAQDWSSHTQVSTTQR